MPAKNYHKILTELFRKYNPAKVKEVDELLRKFAGREEELVEKIKLKYAGKAKSAQSKGKKQRKPLALLLLILLSGGLFFGSWYAAEQGWFGGKEDSPTMIEDTGSGDAGYTQAEAIPDSYEEDENADTESMRVPFSAPPIEYGVQIGLFSDPDNAKIKNRLGDRQVDLNVLPTENGRYMYVIGNDLELDAARERRDELRSNGFPDAFVVGLRKGKRVEVRPGE